jgi:hypothetical protein
MGDELASARGRRLVLSLREYDVPPDRVCACIQCSCRFSGPCARVHAHSREVLSESGPEEARRFPVKALTL